VRAPRIHGTGILKQSTRFSNDSDEEYERVGRELYSQLAGNERTSVETHLVRKDGTVLFVILTAEYLKADDPAAGHIITVQDITKRRLAEEALHESENRVRGILEQAPFSIQVFSPEGDIIFTNRAFEKLWAVTRKTLKGYNILRDHIEALVSCHVRRLSWIPHHADGRVQCNNHVGRARIARRAGHPLPVLDPTAPFCMSILIHSTLPNRHGSRRKGQAGGKHQQHRNEHSNAGRRHCHDFTISPAASWDIRNYACTSKQQPEGLQACGADSQAADRARDLVQHIRPSAARPSPKKSPCPLSPIIKGRAIHAASCRPPSRSGLTMP
jgi:PAS domain S-box-containing protein